jgi:hypothetical protein
VAWFFLPALLGLPMTDGPLFLPGFIGLFYIAVPHVGALTSCASRKRFERVSVYEGVLRVGL